MKTLQIITLILLVSITTLSQPLDTYEVYAIEYAAKKNQIPATKMVVGAAPTDSISLTYYIWFLKGDNGKKILVDVGFIKDSTKSNDYLQDYQRPDRALEKLNVKPDEITDIIITHPHGDHINGLNLFKNGTVWMQKNDFTYFVRDAWQKGGNNFGLDKKDVLKIVQANLDGKLHLVDGDSIEIIPGIRVFTGSRHTFESQHLLVNTKKDKVLLASDDCWYYYNLDNLLPVTLLFDPDAYVRGLRRMKTLVTDPRSIIPGHDSLVLTRFPAVAEGIVKIR
jgi:glyoxylase-like metal-dependent hydrolase (beta-lactamase superfamily II)